MISSVLKIIPRISNFSYNLLLLRNRHFLFADLLILLFAPSLALILRTDRIASLEQYVSGLIAYTILATLVRLCIFFAAGFYRHYWRFASVNELVLIVAIVIISTILLTGFTLTTSYTFNLTIGIPSSLPLIDGMLVLIFISGIRFSIRIIEYWRRRSLHSHSTPVAIMGAGVAGALCWREIESNPQLGLYVVGFIDDNPKMQDVRIHGTPVLGNRHNIAKLAREHRINHIIIAMPSVPGSEIRKIVAICDKENIETKTMPSLSEIWARGFTLDKVRNVELEDLLRREPIETDRDGIRRLIAGKQVLVTGGGGSIGSELCRQILQCFPEKLIILGHGENSVFEIHRELHDYVQTHQNDGRQPAIKTVIADIRFGNRLQHVFQAHKPDVVFHAAAHKHVPLMEEHPTEAIDNNILGTQNVLKASVAAGVQRFVMVSSDKAVNPTNVMGASKRCAEFLVYQTAKKTGLPYVAVRFGNVLGSRGSVVLTFKEQIARGGPVTVTHPDMRRFFMTIPEAVQLVLQAGALGNGGEVFMLDMGKPIKISQLAKDLIELSGLMVERDIAIEYSGLRPGEKLFEELFIAGEEYGHTTHEKIMIVANAGNLVPHDLDELIETLFLASQRNDDEAVIRLLRVLVPEYTPLQATHNKPITQQQSIVQSNGQLVNAMS